MADDIIEGPDANQVRRHAKKMNTEQQYRQRYRRCDFYEPNPFQLSLHNAPKDARLINLRAANGSGKTLSAAMQCSYDMQGDYPFWYMGRQFLTVPKIIRSYNFQVLISSITSQVLRDGLAKALLGDLSQEDGLGSGALPLDCIQGRPTMSRGISDYFDTVVINRAIGGQAMCTTRTYDAGRRVFQGVPYDQVFLDEDDPGLADIFGEIWARLTATRGRCIMTATAIIGLTYMQKLFTQDMAAHPERHLIVGDLSQATHLSEEDKKSIESGTRDDEREARIHGGIRQGSGAVFAFNRADIACQIDPATLGVYNTFFLAGIDLAHSSGPTAHPFAYVLLAQDRDADVVYVLDAWEMRGAMAVQHVERIKASPVWDCRIAWPKDGGIHDLNSGHTLIQCYKSRGLNTLPEHSTFADGSVSLEASVNAVQERLFSGRLKIQSHLGELLTQLGNYHRDTEGRIVPSDDDLVSALLCAMRSLRLARPLGPANQYEGRRSGGSSIAKDVEFDVFSGRHDATSIDDIIAAGTAHRRS